MCTLPYELPEHNRVAADVWSHLIQQFPGAEISTWHREDINRERSVREDREDLHQSIVFRVDSANPEHDTACPDEQEKLLALVNARGASQSNATLSPENQKNDTPTR